MTALTISKLDAARRQLQTAITLWFGAGDPVSIHTLAYASYEIIHALSKQRNPGRRDLLFDTLVVKDEYRREWADLVKRHANFFKHAKDDAKHVIEFNPALSELFILFALLGVELSGERHNDEELAFLYWFQIHRSDLLTDEGRKKFEQAFSVDQRKAFRTIPKNEFLQAIRIARRLKGL